MSSPLSAGVVRFPYRYRLFFRGRVVGDDAYRYRYEAATSETRRMYRYLFSFLHFAFTFVPPEKHWQHAPCAITRLQYSGGIIVSEDEGTNGSDTMYILGWLLATRTNSNRQGTGRRRRSILVFVTFTQWRRGQRVSYVCIGLHEGESIFEGVVSDGTASVLSMFPLLGEKFDTERRVGCLRDSGLCHGRPYRKYARRGRYY